MVIVLYLSLIIKKTIFGFLRGEGVIRQSEKKVKDAYYGNGVYLTVLDPSNNTPAQILENNNNIQGN